jgi:hypothetical protein
LSKIDVFVAPEPKRWMIRATSVLNRVAMLHGVPGLRDLWPFSSIPGIRAIANVRTIDLPDADLARLRSVCGKGRATFIVPNHPEFFTDWMIDKELLWRTAPMAASWATHTVVNGLGRLMQRFWLANNLIAQIPGNSEPAKRHSVEWAAKGHCVLLHPEGAVSWHNDWVAPLMPGAAEMAAEALELGRKTDPKFRAFLAPVVWKFVFLGDAEPGLLAEADYVARRLGMHPIRGSSAERVFAIYDALMRRDAEKYGLAMSTSMTLQQRQAALIELLRQDLARAIGQTEAVIGRDELLRAARRWLRKNKAAEPSLQAEVRELAEDLARVRRLGPFAFEARDITQEQVAEHLKRLRSDYCKGTLRDSINRFLPQPVAPRRAIIRVPEPLEIADPDLDVDETIAELRRRLQQALDVINEDLRTQGAFRTQPNPFHAAP